MGFWLGAQTCTGTSRLPWGVCSHHNFLPTLRHFLLKIPGIFTLGYLVSRRPPASQNESWSGRANLVVVEKGLEVSLSADFIIKLIFLKLFSTVGLFPNSSPVFRTKYQAGITSSTHPHESGKGIHDKRRKKSPWSENTQEGMKRNSEMAQGISDQIPEGLFSAPKCVGASTKPFKPLLPIEQFTKGQSFASRDSILPCS